MEKFEALESIKRTWASNAMPLGDKIISISTDYYSAGLDFATTAAYIHATPSELDALLSMSELEDDLISEISEVNPPKTAWTFLSSASEEEAREALDILRAKGSAPSERFHTGMDFYYTMCDIAGPTPEQRVANLSGEVLEHALKKGKDFDALTDWQKKFLKSIAAQKKQGKTLSEKQINQLIKALRALVDKGAVTRNSIDGDQDICDAILDALGD